MLNFIKTEPVFFYGLIQVLIIAAVNLVTTFGLSFTGEQVAALNGFLLAVSAIVLSLVARSKVTPV